MGQMEHKTGVFRPCPICHFLDLSGSSSPCSGWGHLAGLPLGSAAPLRYAKYNNRSKAAGRSSGS